MLYLDSNCELVSDFPPGGGFLPVLRALIMFLDKNGVFSSFLLDDDLGKELPFEIFEKLSAVKPPGDGFGQFWWRFWAILDDWTEWA